jgi:hypothetical protein
METKYCPKCETHKEIREFIVSKIKNSYRARCTECLIRSQLNKREGMVDMTCRHCQQTLPVGRFPLGRRQCHDCINKKLREYRKDVKYDVDRNDKVCTICHIILPYTAYRKCAQMKTGTRNICKICEKQKFLHVDDIIIVN